MTLRTYLAEGLTAALLITMPLWSHWLFWWIAGAKPWDTLV